MIPARYPVVLLGLLLVAGTAAAAPPAPVAGFTAEVFTGPVPLVVQFLDQSTLSPTGWAWFFGDETYRQPWTLVNGSAGWEGRMSPGAVVLKDGSVVLTGGYLIGWRNDTWRSTDKGNVWFAMNRSSGWPIRDNHDSVILPDDSIVLMGGYGEGNYYNDTWRSTDKGATWTLMNASSGWLVRDYLSCVALPDGSIVLTGGSNLGSYEKNDTWRSTDYGATWARINTSSGWAARTKHSSTAMPDGSIVLTGGSDGTNDFNDTWRSTDRGASWTRMNASSGWPARHSHSTMAMPDGSILLMGGYDGDSLLYNDVWRSSDNGVTWMAVNESAGWSPRLGHAAVGLSDGSVLLIGGVTGPAPSYRNDTWRFQPAGSTLSNPEHTYTLPGVYGAALVVRNAGGFNSTRKDGFITVTNPVKIGIFRNSTHQFYLDYNGNGAWNGAVTDRRYSFGMDGDLSLAGDWDNSGRQRIGIFRPSTHQFSLDYNGNGVWDGTVTDRRYTFGIAEDVPVTGDWNGDRISEIGIFRNSTHLFYLDYNGNGAWDGAVTDRRYNFGISGDIPVAGDWNDNGVAEIGIFRPSTHLFYQDYNGNGAWNGITTDRRNNFGMTGDRPLAGRW